MQRVPLDIIASRARERRIEPMGRRWLSCTFLGLAIILLGRPASAQLSEDWKRCVNRNKVFSTKIAISGCTAVIASGIESPKNLSIAYSNRGTMRLQNGKPDQAITDFNEAIELDPGDARFFAKRGIAYRDTGDNNHALADYSEAIRLNATMAFLYELRARALSDMGQNERAVDDQEKFIALQKPKDPWPWIGLAVYQRSLKQYDAALASLRNAEKLDEDGPGTGPGMAVYYHTGWTLQLSGRHAEAIEAFNKGIPKQPSYYWAKFRRGLSYEQLGEREKAAQDFKDAAANIERKEWSDEFKNKISEYGLQ